MPQLDQLIILPIMVAFLLVFLWLIYYFDFGSNNPLNNTDIQIIFIAFVLITFLL